MVWAPHARIAHRSCFDAIWNPRERALVLQSRKCFVPRTFMQCAQGPRIGGRITAHMRACAACTCTHTQAQTWLVPPQRRKPAVGIAATWHCRDFAGCRTKRPVRIIEENSGPACFATAVAMLSKWSRVKQLISISEWKVLSKVTTPLNRH